MRHYFECQDASTTAKSQLQTFNTSLALQEQTRKQLIQERSQWLLSSSNNNNTEQQPLLDLAEREQSVHRILSQLQRQRSTLQRAQSSHETA